MANQRQENSTLFDTIAETARREGGSRHPPVHLWDPPFCGDLDLRIASDGAWYYLGTPIGRPALVRLFASVLKREGERYFLVTPVEKVGIVVEDAPFIAGEMQIEREGGAQVFGAQVLHFPTNVDDVVTCGGEHPLRFEQDPETGGVKPYLHVRAGLWAKVTRALFFDLVDIGEEREIDGRSMFGIASGHDFFVMADAAMLRDIS